MSDEVFDLKVGDFITATDPETGTSVRGKIVELGSTWYNVAYLDSRRKHD